MFQIEPALHPGDSRHGPIRGRHSRARPGLRDLPFCLLRRVEEAVQQSVGVLPQDGARALGVQEDSGHPG